MCSNSVLELLAGFGVLVPDVSSSRIASVHGLTKLNRCFFTNIKTNHQTNNNNNNNNNMKFILAIVTLAVLSVASAESVRGGQQRELTSSSDYKYIEVYDKDADKYKCWEAVEESGYYYVKAKDCNHSKQKQDWYYTQYGELKNRHYDDYCVHYDYDKNNYEYLVLKECDGKAYQAWNYIDYHFVSHYDGYCVDLHRQGGGKFEVKKCKKSNKDQEHHVEDYWFYGW